MSIHVVISENQKILLDREVKTHTARQTIIETAVSVLWWLETHDIKYDEIRIYRDDNINYHTYGRPDFIWRRS